MVDGLREDNFLQWYPAEPGPPVYSMKFLANSQSGLCKEVGRSAAALENDRYAL
jgi:hypothetical protein